MKLRCSFFLLILVIMISLWITPCIAEGHESEMAVQPLPIDFSGGARIDPNGYIGEWEYSDPTIHVTIKSGRHDDCDYWVADIKIGHASQLRTAAADSFSSNMAMPGETIAKRVNAVLAIDGDYYCFSRKGFIVRQGTLFKDVLEGQRDVLLIDEDGDFHFVHAADTKDVSTEINGKKVINSFYFGPVLVENGVLNTRFGRDEMAFKDPCQRMCISQEGPLHYKAVCCAAPFRGSSGMTMKQFAQFVYDLGLTNAYNMDGGDSTMMIFKGKKINDVDNPKTRDLVDIIYFASSMETE